ncbi:hypothetical protein [Tsukamurella tyrosinosolvens]|uniref:hypothetical protein n=1 Tax=Tsukamurella tyrosinosolvens TaxID=57704 RepID=UPI0034632F63
MTGEYIFMYAMLILPVYIALDCLTGWYLTDLALRVAWRMKVSLRGSQAAKTAPPDSHRVLRRETSSRRALRELETSSFEAYTHCGCCGKLDYHPMRDPICTEDDILTVIGPWAKAKVDSGEIALEWIGECIRKRWPLVPEVDFDVIRTCSSCSHEWGQK